MSPLPGSVTRVFASTDRAASASTSIRGSTTPRFPASEKEIERIDVLALTHGHSDHSGSAVDIYKQHSPTVVCMLELADWLGSKGSRGRGINKGGTVDVDGVRVTMTDAHHSSSTA